jgi:hypothetical protein
MGSGDGDQQGAVARSVKLGGDQIELEDQSPRIHELYVKETRRTGGEVHITPPGA